MLFSKSILKNNIKINKFTKRAKNNGTNKIPKMGGGLIHKVVRLAYQIDFICHIYCLSIF